MTVKEAIEKLIEGNQHIQSVAAKQVTMLEALLRAATAGEAAQDSVSPEPEPEEVGIPARAISLTEYEELYEPRPHLRQLQSVVRELRSGAAMPFGDMGEFAHTYGKVAVSASNLSGLAQDVVHYNKDSGRHYVAFTEKNAERLVRVLSVLNTLTETDETSEQVEDTETV